MSGKYAAIPVRTPGGFWWLGPERQLLWGVGRGGPALGAEEVATLM